jgi:hypothetical protein
MKKFKLSTAGNTVPSAFELIKDLGFVVSKKNDIWKAENEKALFIATSPLELLGLITLYNAKGENWQVSDEKIDAFVRFDEGN